MVKNLPANAGDSRDLTPGWGRSPGVGNDNPLQYSCLENSMNRGCGEWKCIYAHAFITQPVCVFLLVHLIHLHLWQLLICMILFLFS